MDEWQGRCNGCLREFRIQLNPGSDPYADPRLEIKCPFCRPGVLLGEWARLRKVTMKRTSIAERFRNAIT